MQKAIGVCLLLATSKLIAAQDAPPLAPEATAALVPVATAEDSRWTRTLERVATGVVTIQLLTSTNPSTIPANIALKFGEAGYGLNVNVLIGTGLVLFVVTFGVNALARWIVSRRSEFSGAN